MAPLGRNLDRLQSGFVVQIAWEQPEAEGEGNTLSELRARFARECKSAFADKFFIERDARYAVNSKT